MDDTVGDVPSEGGDSSRRHFGIYRAFTPEPRVFRIGRLSLLFVACVAAVVVFAVFCPMLQFASRSSKPVLPFPEIANNASEKDNSNTNCSSNVLSFGHDCTETPKTSTEEPTTVFDGQSDEASLNTETVQYDTTRPTLDNDAEVVAETRHVKILRTGRSRWPVVSTPYPYYLPKPTVGITERSESDSEEAIIFAIPSDMNREHSTSHSNNKPIVNFTPPPYAFTPFPNFTDSYAQLLPYKVPTNCTNFGEIMKYLNGNEEKSVTSSTERAFAGNRRLSTMKVSGTYVMPLDRRRTGDGTASSSGKIDWARPFFNGHAYVSDPFVKFRPSNPIDVNRLVPLRPDIGSRFRRPFPTSPSTPSAQDTRDRDLQAAAAGTYTEAVFHGAGPSDLLTPPPKPKDKPLSVTLDIYPVTMEMPVSEGPKDKWRGRFRHPQRPPRWRRPPVTQTPDNHMVVHLNLFPNKRKPYTFPRRGDYNSAASTPTTTLLNGGHFGARSFADPLSSDQLNDQTRVTTVPFSSTAMSWSSTTHNLPEFSALTGALRGEGKEEQLTTEVVAIMTESKVTSKNRSVKGKETNETVVDGNTDTNETGSYDGSSHFGEENKEFTAKSFLGGIDSKMATSSSDDIRNGSNLDGQLHSNISVKIIKLIITLRLKNTL